MVLSIVGSLFVETIEWNGKEQRVQQVDSETRLTLSHLPF